MACGFSLQQLYAKYREMHDIDVNDSFDSHSTFIHDIYINCLSFLLTEHKLFAMVMQIYWPTYKILTLTRNV